MFLTNRRSGYDRSGQQVASGLFFLMFSNPDKTKELELRACVRFVAMEQLGHFMMGGVRIAGYSLTVSGSLGSDGLPMRLDRHFVGLDNGQAKFAGFTDEQKAAIWEQLTPLPADLAETYWKSDGHNDVGNAGPALRKWAKENMAKLRGVIHRV